MQRSQYKRETSSSWETKQLTNVWMISWIEISFIPAFAKVKMGVYYQVAPRRSLFIRTAPVFREKEKAWKVGEHDSCYQKRATPARSWTKFHQDQGQWDKVTKMTNIIKGCSVLPNMNTKAKRNIKTIAVKSIPLYHCWPSEQPSLPRPRKQRTLSKEELHQAGLRPRRTLFTFPRSKPCLHLTSNSKII